MASCNYYYWKCHMHRCKCTHKIKPYKMSPVFMEPFKITSSLGVAIFASARIHDMINAFHKTKRREVLESLKIENRTSEWTSARVNNGRESARTRTHMAVILETWTHNTWFRLTKWRGEQKKTYLFHILFSLSFD